jgi:hypothetical protein
MNRFSSLTQVRASTGVLTLVAIGARRMRTLEAGALNPVNLQGSGRSPIAPA